MDGQFRSLCSSGSLWRSGWPGGQRPDLEFGYNISYLFYEEGGAMSEHWLAIRNGSVIETAGETEPRVTDVIIRNNRIVAVGGDALEGLEHPAVETMEQIDARGLTVMPGLVDAHCHMTY